MVAEITYNPDVLAEMPQYVWEIYGDVLYMLENPTHDGSYKPTEDKCPEALRHALRYWGGSGLVVNVN